MLGKKEFIGLALDDDAIKVARVKVDGNKLHLLKLDRYSLVESIRSSAAGGNEADEPDIFAEAEEDADAIFGLGDNQFGQEPEEEINFEDLEADAGDDDEEFTSLDMVNEAQAVQSNEILLYNILADLDPKKVRLGLNIPAGNTIFQIIRDTNFSEVKTKDLVEDLESKLESIYGISKSPDNYSYHIMEDGTLMLASVDEESPLLQLLNRTRQLYTGKIHVDEIYADEVALVGLIRANYFLEEHHITGIIQFGSKKCRIIFMQGDRVLQFSPIVNEGTSSKTFLNTVFSKILFQLDTGEVPSLDQVIIANNSIGGEAVRFFQKNFPDIRVEEFQYSEPKFDFADIDPATASSFTTAIGMAWAASGYEKGNFPDLSLIPSYVAERQKMFKLQWHGVILLFLIFLGPLTFNYFYQLNAKKIDTLSSNIYSVDNQIEEIIPTANNTNELAAELALLRGKLVLLDTLSKGSREWSAKLDIINNGTGNLRGVWFTSMAQSQGGTFVEGYSLYRSLIDDAVNIFGDATLMNVTIEEQREKEVFRFSIMVHDFAKDSAAYSPEKPQELKEIINN